MKPLIWILLWVPAAAWAASDMPPLVQDIGISVLLAGALAILFNRFKIPSIAAFLVAGILAGPVGARLVTDPNNVNTIAQLGLVLLLFLIGLELDFRKILTHGKTILITGLLQFPLTVVFGIFAAKLLVLAGLGSAVLEGGKESSYVPLYVGLILASSSTLIVAKLLQESFQLDTTSGRVSLTVLIFQDIWAVIVLALQPTLHQLQVNTILVSFLGIAVLAVAAVLFTKYVLPLCFAWIAKAPELILGAAVAWCFGVVFLGGSLGSMVEAMTGLHLPLAVGPGMGALIAGATLANLPYSTLILSKVGTVKDFFVTLFFVGLGMGIPVPDGPTVVLLALAFAVLAIAARYLVFLPLMYFSGLDRRNAFVASTRLAQISEFSLVIAYLGMGLGHISASLNSVIIFAFVITALITPILFKQADALHERLAPLLTRLGLKEPVVDDEAAEKTYRLALLGFHRLAASLLNELRKTEPKVLKEMLIVDFNVHIHGAIAKYGPTVRYGDLASPESFEHVGIDKAEVVAITVQDDLLKGTSNFKLVEAVRRLNPKATIIANAIDPEEATRLYEVGADFVYMPYVGSAQGLLPAVSSALVGGLHHYRSEKEAASSKEEFITTQSEAVK